MAQTSVQISVPEETAELIRAKVASGAYASENQGIREGLDALEARDALETWLVEEVGPTFDRVQSGEEELIPIEEVFGGLEELHRERNEAR